MAVHTQPTLSPGMSARIAKAAALSPSLFCTLELVEDTEDESSDSDTKGEGSEDEGPTSEDEGLGSEEEDEPLGISYGELRRHELALGYGSVRATWVDHVDDILYTDILIDVLPVRVPVQTSPSPEWSSGSLPVSSSSLVVPTLVASPTTTPATTIAVDEDEFLEVGAQLELYGSILHDHTQHSDTLPLALFEGYDRDLRELYTKSRERAEMWPARYDGHRLIHDLLLQNTTMQRELQEMRDCVTSLEQEGNHKGQ
nr:hypothetical protein [Tanacetum cinerariifolium]